MSPPLADTLAFHLIQQIRLGTRIRLGSHGKARLTVPSLAVGDPWWLRLDGMLLQSSGAAVQSLNWPLLLSSVTNWSRPSQQPGRQNYEE